MSRHVGKGKKSHMYKGIKGVYCEYSYLFCANGMGFFRVGRVKVVDLQGDWACGIWPKGVMMHVGNE
ncbi:hypothetical protein FHX77_000445 [Bifidobacterium commune]|uniref:Uncharacterized protein n=1 Tax=Bifidobacterium commune TaxID=1505727 RepID=A0A1C4H2X5_9BIFI|nr:hypothetical protein [Bifidobacterium commune]SCC79374.1 hypothetical protein GA0061077_0698 [Bifidobacterium commune]